MSAITIWEFLEQNCPSVFTPIFNWVNKKNMGWVIHKTDKEIDSVDGLKKLNIGCGNHILEGWVNADLYYEDDRVVKYDILNMPEEWTDYFDEVLCQHVLEHFGRMEAQKALLNLWRVTKTGGKCVIVVPDLDYCCEIFFSSKDHTVLKEWGFRMLFGSQDYEGDMHKTGFTLEHIKKLVNGIGFGIDYQTYCWSADQKSILIQCRK